MAISWMAISWMASHTDDGAQRNPGNEWSSYTRSLDWCVRLVRRLSRLSRGAIFFQRVQVREKKQNNTVTVLYVTRTTECCCSDIYDIL